MRIISVASNLLSEWSAEKVLRFHQLEKDAGQNGESDSADESVSSSFDDIRADARLMRRRSSSGAKKFGAHKRQTPKFKPPNLNPKPQTPSPKLRTPNTEPRMSECANCVIRLAVPIKCHRQMYGVHSGRYGSECTNDMRDCLKPLLTLLFSSRLYPILN